MGKQKKNGKKVEQATNRINLLTAIISLLVALIALYEKLNG